MAEKYKNYGEVDFEDYELEQKEEEYEKLNQELDKENEKS